MNPFRSFALLLCWWACAAFTTTAPVPSAPACTDPNKHVARAQRARKAHCHARDHRHFNVQLLGRKHAKRRSTTSYLSSVLPYMPAEDRD